MNPKTILEDFSKHWASDPFGLPVLLFIYWYYLPYMLAGSNEVDKWVSAVSLNGVKQANLCN